MYIATSHYAINQSDTNKNTVYHTQTVDCKKEKKMTSLKKIIPYCLFLTAFASTESDSFTNSFENTTENFKEQYKTFLNLTNEYKATKQAIEYKTQLLVNTYIDNVISGTKRIMKNHKKKNYLKSVRSELPGAPYNKEQGTLHCLYGLSTQLKRAQRQLNDTLTLIPTTYNAHQSSQSFKQQMKKLYGNPEYSDAIRSGHLYTTDQEYNNALNKYLKAKLRGRKEHEIDSLKQKYTEDFKKNNYCTTSLKPGTIVITDLGHAVMYYGQGKNTNNKFTPDSNGTAMCCSYNSEHTVIPLNTWSTKNAFTADISKIANKKYEQELITKQPLTYKFAIQNATTQPRTK